MSKPTAERGMALVASLLLLLVMTIMAVGMFRSFGIQDKIAGNTREKQRARHASGSAQVYAEWWLKSGNGVNTLTTPVACTGPVSADQGLVQVCASLLANPADPASWAKAGNTYTPPGLTVGTGGTDTYYSIPSFNIAFLYAPPFNQQTKTQTTFYQIDALGYGGTSSTVSVVAGMYEVNVTYGATAQGGKNGEFVNLGGP
jgi:type IV pilus assembly protein PilX